MIYASSYNVVGDGVTPNKTAIQNAIDATPSGDTLVFDPGVYVGDGSTPLNNPSAYVKITRPITIQGTPDVVFKNLMFWVQGEYSTTLAPASAISSGAKEISLPTNHGLLPGDFIQLRSEYNVYTDTAPEFQMGGVNPTTGSTTDCCAAEIHQILSFSSTNTARLADNTRYKYGTTAQIKKLNMVKNVVFDHITFDYSSHNMGRGILARVVSNLRFSNCSFVGGSQSGRHFGCTDVHGLTFENIHTRRDITTASGSSWNSFIVGGGTTGVLVKGGNFHGEYQNIDFSPNRLISVSDPGTDTSFPTSSSTCQDISVIDSDFYDCANSVTTHPACYDFSYTSNRVHSGSIGVLCRSRRSFISDNSFYTSNAGVVLSSYVEDTHISNNLFTYSPSSNRSSVWDGISYAPTSSEIQTNNKIQRLTITNNIFRSTAPSTSQWGVRLAHQPPSSYTIPDPIKTGISRILVQDNYFDRTSMNVGSWINGAIIKDNTFHGGSSQSHYIRCDLDSCRTIITDNTFNPTSTCRGIKTSTASSTLFSYSTVNLIGPQRWIYSGATMDLENATTLIQSTGV